MSTQGFLAVLLYLSGFCFVFLQGLYYALKSLEVQLFFPPIRFSPQESFGFMIEAVQTCNYRDFDLETPDLVAFIVKYFLVEHLPNMVLYSSIPWILVGFLFFMGTVKRLGKRKRTLSENSMRFS